MSKTKLKSEERREIYKQWFLQHVMDSKEVDANKFAEECMRIEGQELDKFVCTALSRGFD